MGPCREPADGDRPAGRRLKCGFTPRSEPKARPGAGRREARKGGSPRYAAMERREARVLDRKRTRRRKAAIQDEALIGAPSPSGYLKGEKKRSRRTPRHKEQGRFRAAVTFQRAQSSNLLVRSIAK